MKRQRTRDPRLRGYREALFPALSLGLLVGAVAMMSASCAPGGSAPPGGSKQAIANSHNDIVRFLEQATFGPTPASIQHLEQDLHGDFNAWLDEQFAMDISNYPNVCCDGSRSDTDCYPVTDPCGAEDFYALPTTAPSDCAPNTECRRDNYTMWKLQQIFYRNALTAQDQLRQRVFFALNQILVTSAQDGQINYADRMTYYLRMLEQSAFANYRQILYDLTLNPTMGRYLDNITNTRTQPNENYAREVMQLFSIGLVVLQPDGTTDGTPTYGQETVVDLTKALSGWQNAPRIAHNNSIGVNGQDVVNYSDPLVAPSAARHNIEAKVLFPGTPWEVRVPANQSAAVDLNMAIDGIFNHPNVGPFIGKALIQMMVTSNPSSAYVSRVTQAFNNNGSGVRGDLQAVIRAILTDDEARNESPNGNYGKLREPVLAVTNLLRNLGYTLPDPTQDPDPVSDFALMSPGGTGTAYLVQGEDVFRAPTVFNFFPPSFPVPGASDLVGPEFGDLSTTTTLSRDNLVYQLINGTPTFWFNALYRPNFARVDLSGLPTDDPAALVEALNQQLLHGQMSQGLRDAVTNGISGLTGTQLVNTATFLVASSAAYQVQR